MKEFCWSSRPDVLPDTSYDAKVGISSDSMESRMASFWVRRSCIYRMKSVHYFYVKIILIGTQKFSKKTEMPRII